MCSDKIVIGMIGLPGSGKTTFANMLIEKATARSDKKCLSVVRIGVSDILSKTLKQYGIEPTRSNLQDLGLFLCKIQYSAVSIAVTNTIISCPEQVAVFDPIRTVADYEVLTLFDCHALVYLVTDNDEVRFERMRDRGQKGEKSKSNNEFREAEEHPVELEIQELSSKADYIIPNNSTLDTLRREVVKLMIILGIIQ